MNHHRLPAKPRRFTSLIKPLLLSIAIGLIPVVSGTFILYWEVDRSQTRSSIDAGRRAIVQIDRALERADDITARAASMAGQECAAVLEPMRRLVASYLSVRSLVLADAQQSYCSSEMGPISVPFTPQVAARSKLLLRTTSVSMPDRPSLVFSRFEGAQTVNAVVDAQLIAELISHGSNGTAALLENNGLFLGKDGRVEKYAYDSHAEHHSVQVSSLYGYSLHAGYPEGHSMHAFRAQAYPMLGTLALLGIVTAGACFWLSRQRQFAT